MAIARSKAPAASLLPSTSGFGAVAFGASMASSVLRTSSAGDVVPHVEGSFGSCTAPVRRAVTRTPSTAFPLPSITRPRRWTSIGWTAATGAGALRPASPGASAAASARAASSSPSVVGPGAEGPPPKAYQRPAPAPATRRSPATQTVDRAMKDPLPRAPTAPLGRRGRGKPTRSRLRRTSPTPRCTRSSGAPSRSCAARGPRGRSRGCVGERPGPRGGRASG